MGKSKRRRTAASTDATPSKRPHVGEKKTSAVSPANHIRVSANGKIKSYVSQVLTLIETGKHPYVRVIGESSAITKAVSVVEIVKRRKDEKLHQYTSIGTADADSTGEQDLERLTPAKAAPSITIYLSTEQVPDLQGASGYQPPTA